MSLRGLHLLSLHNFNTYELNRNFLLSVCFPNRFERIKKCQSSNLENYGDLFTKTKYSKLIVESAKDYSIILEHSAYCANYITPVNG